MPGRRRSSGFSISTQMRICALPGSISGSTNTMCPGTVCDEALGGLTCGRGSLAGRDRRIRPAENPRSQPIQPHDPHHRLAGCNPFPRMTLDPDHKSVEGSQQPMPLQLLLGAADQTRRSGMRNSKTHGPRGFRQRRQFLQQAIEFLPDVTGRFGSRRFGNRFHPGIFFRYPFPQQRLARKLVRFRQLRFPDRQDHAEAEDAQGHEETLPPDRPGSCQAPPGRDQPFAVANVEQAQAQSAGHHHGRQVHGEEHPGGFGRLQLLMLRAAQPTVAAGR